MGDHLVRHVVTNSADSNERLLYEFDCPHRVYVPRILQASGVLTFYSYTCTLKPVYIEFAVATQVKVPLL